MNQSINTDSKNSKEPQQKYRLGTVSIKILGGLEQKWKEEKQYIDRLMRDLCYIRIKRFSNGTTWSFI